MDFSAFFSLLEAMYQPFKRIKEVFDSKTFFTERRHLHFAISALIVTCFFVLGDDVKALQIEYFPFWFVLVFGWFFAYGWNFAREWVLAKLGLAKWDWIDIYAGCYGGLVVSILYLFFR